jgi:hypothetical protein
MLKSGPPDLNQHLACEPSSGNILRTMYSFCWFTMQFSLLVRNVCRDDGDKSKCAHCTSFLAYLHHNSHFCEFWHLFCTVGPGFWQLSWESVLDVVWTTLMGMQSHCFFKGFKIPFGKSLPLHTAIRIWTLSNVVSIGLSQIQAGFQSHKLHYAEPVLVLLDGMGLCKMSQDKERCLWLINFISLGYPIPGFLIATYLQVLFIWDIPSQIIDQDPDFSILGYFNFGMRYLRNLIKYLWNIQYNEWVLGEYMVVYLTYPIDISR